MPLTNSSNETIGVLGVYEDITEQKQVEIALKKSEQRYRAAFETSLDSININRLSDGTYMEHERGIPNHAGLSARGVDSPGHGSNSTSGRIFVTGSAWWRN